MTNNRMKTVVRLLVAFLVLSVLTVSAAVMLRHHPAIVTPAVWIRTPLVALSAAVLLLVARRAAGGHRGAYRRLRVIATVVLIAIVAVVAWPGAFPVWLRIEQAVCGLLMLSVVILVNSRAARTAPVSDRG